ncbi:hypothetical protein EOA51_32720, partial [Mesorhizobium sp. M1A.F.Ca.IN.020.32.1.1]|uniref:hypothetical protein n=1 Tax=Mesorhizobium sp. M1A.F.Ca.IN.020.32.1.1 TaxID=2496763 RepID=UPI000FD4CE3B
MRSIEERGKAPISVFGAIEHSVVDDTPAEPAVGVEGPGQSSCSVVEQTRGEPQASSVSPQPSSSVLHLQPELLGEIAERLSPIDLLMMSQTNQQLRVGAMVVVPPQESRQRAIRVQAIWNKLTEPQPGVDPSAVLIYPSVIQSLAPNLNCLTRVQQERLVALFEGLAKRKDRASALWGLGKGVAGLAPELQPRFVALVEALAEPQYRASALWGLGKGVAGLAPELQP